MDAVIISVGTELVTGQCVDTNSAWLSGEISRFAVRIVEHVTVGDDADRLERTIRRAIGDADIVIMTGGLGPTADDITRGALADAIGKPLEENAEALDQIRTLFERWQRPMSDANRVQAMVPRGCEVIPNGRGTAPGIRYRGEQTQVFALPGVPSEMKAMFTAAIEPVISAATGGSATVTARLLCFGIHEAKVGELLADLMDRTRNPLVGTTASEAVISVRVMARMQILRKPGGFSRPIWLRFAPDWGGRCSVKVMNHCRRSWPGCWFSRARPSRRRNLARVGCWPSGSRTSRAAARIFYAGMSRTRTRPRIRFFRCRPNSLTRMGRSASRSHGRWRPDVERSPVRILLCRSPESRDQTAGIRRTSRSVWSTSGWPTQRVSK